MSAMAAITSVNPPGMPPLEDMLEEHAFISTVVAGRCEREREEVCVCVSLVRKK